ncbi:uncharacterized protein LOC131032497 isoform X1 [Cryptomeria japonica]|uniref:uncharacterized protein LOC131032497 isoform X1 n=1 Tax=Cryptomeria japonica TaxID=3369 RepID=UPI0027D9EC2F|nr:uncharacterized protein LOC131032497 isoform X1 [Cryptomeria japonica]
MEKNMAVDGQTHMLTSPSTDELAEGIATGGCSEGVTSLMEKMKDPEDVSREKSPEISTRVLTVNFSARNYKGTLEACDGLAVEITKEIEKSLTRAQRWSTLWRHRRENSQSSYSTSNLLWLALAFVVVWIASVTWMFLNGVNLTQWKKLKYGSIPATVMAIFVPAPSSSVSFFKLKPVSHYVSLRFSSEYSEQYGQQQRVISDIKFLK